MLILNGNGADVAKHCVPSVPAKRLSNFVSSMHDINVAFLIRISNDQLTIGNINPKKTQLFLMQTLKRFQNIFLF